jgi:oligo-1,6-glucosidase
MTLPGIPFIFQGQEFGALNADFKDISQIKDVESLGLYEALLAKGMPEEEAFKKVLSGTRDHARLMLDWTKAVDNPVKQCFKDMIALRKKRRELLYGETEFYHIHKKNYFTYTRRLDGNILTMECNLYNGIIKSYGSGSLLYSTYQNGNKPAEPHGAADLRPYECQIYVNAGVLK